MTFRGKSVIVTGATSGIGRAAAEAFGREGASVVVVGRKDAVVAEVTDAVTRAGGRGAPCVADVTSDAAPARIVGAATGAFGGIDILVNAAGIIATATLEATSDETWDSMMAV